VFVYVSTIAFISLVMSFSPKLSSSFHIDPARSEGLDNNDRER